MTADFPVILDACVWFRRVSATRCSCFSKHGFFWLAGPTTLLRKSERTLETKLQKTPEQTEHLVAQLRGVFR